METMIEKVFINSEINTEKFDVLIAKEIQTLQTQLVMRMSVIEVILD